MKKTTITEHEFKDILNQHISKGYKTILNEQSGNNDIEVVQDFIRRLESAGSAIGIEYAFKYLSGIIKGNELDDVLETLENETIGGKSGLSKYMESRFAFHVIDEMVEINETLIDAGAKNYYTYTHYGRGQVKDIELKKSTKKQKDSISPIEKSTKKQKDSISPIEKSTKKQKDPTEEDMYKEFTKILGKNSNKFFEDSSSTFIDNYEVYFIQDYVEYILINKDGKLRILKYDEEPLVEDYELFISEVSNTGKYELFAKLDDKTYNLEELFDLEPKFIETEVKFKTEEIFVKNKKLEIVVPENGDLYTYIKNGRKVRSYRKYKTRYSPIYDEATLEDFDIDSRAINIYFYPSKDNNEKYKEIATQIFGENHLVYNFTNKQMVQKIYEFGEQVYGDGIKSLVEFNNMMYMWQEKYKDFDVNRTMMDDFENVVTSASVWYQPGQCVIADDIVFNYDKGRYELSVLYSREIGWPDGFDAQLDKGIGAEFLKHTSSLPKSHNNDDVNDYMKRSEELMIRYQLEMGICYHPNYGEPDITDIDIAVVNKN